MHSLSYRSSWRYRWSRYQNTPLTPILCGLLIFASVVLTVLQRTGSSLSVFILAWDIDALAHGQLWRLFSYPFVSDTPLGVLFGVISLYYAGHFFESSYGRSLWGRFVLFISGGSAILGIVLHFVCNSLLTNTDSGIALGPFTLIDATLVVLAVSFPYTRMLFGMVLPMSARNMVLILLILDVLLALMQGSSTIAMTLSSMVLGYLWTQLPSAPSWQSRKTSNHRLYLVRNANTTGSKLNLAYFKMNSLHKIDNSLLI